MAFTTRCMPPGVAFEPGVGVFVATDPPGAFALAHALGSPVGHCGDLALAELRANRPVEAARVTALIDVSSAGLPIDSPNEDVEHRGLLSHHRQRTLGQMPDPPPDIWAVLRSDSGANDHRHGGIRARSASAPVCLRDDSLERSDKRRDVRVLGL